MNIELLEKAARKFVEIWPEEKFDMKLFHRDKNGNWSNPRKCEILKPFCGTSVCFGGSLPWLGIPELEPIENDFFLSGRICYNKYSERLFGMNHNDEWKFIFSEDWPDDKLEVLGRVMHLKKHGVPSDIDFKKSYKEYI